MLRSCTRHGENTASLMRALARHQRSHELPIGPRVAVATLVGPKPRYTHTATHTAPPWRPASVLDE